MSKVDFSFCIQKQRKKQGNKGTIRPVSLSVLKALKLKKKALKLSQKSFKGFSKKL